MKPKSRFIRFPKCVEATEKKLKSLSKADQLCDSIRHKMSSRLNLPNDAGCSAEYSPIEIKRYEKKKQRITNRRTKRNAQMKPFTWGSKSEESMQNCLHTHTN